MNKFNAEDYRDHRTVALAARARGLPVSRFSEEKYLFSINLKHRMVTFPIGKCRPNEGLIDGLIREMKEELAVTIETYNVVTGPEFKFTKSYSFTGQPVMVETNVFRIDGEEGHWICSQAKNNEPAKCGGLFLATLRDASSIAQTCGLVLADCVMEFYNFHRTCV